MSLSPYHQEYSEHGEAWEVSVPHVKRLAGVVAANNALTVGNILQSLGQTFEEGKGLMSGYIFNMAVTCLIGSLPNGSYLEYSHFPPGCAQQRSSRRVHR